MKIAKVAVEAATFSFDKTFDYRVPAELADKVKIGCRVVVPFGNGNKKSIGIVFDSAENSDSKRLKSINSLLDEEPLLNDEMLSLARWIKDRTFCTLFDASKVMLPSGINHRMVSSYAVNGDITAEKLSSLDSREREIAEFLIAKSVFVKTDALFKALAMQPDERCQQRCRAQSR